MSGRWKAAVLIAPLLALAGCDALVLRGGGAAPQPLYADPPPEADYLRGTAVQGGQDDEADSAVQESIVLHEKYAQAMESLLRAQQSNEQLAARNRQQEQQIRTLQAELAQAQKELAEASDMLVEMRKELDRWRTDVLGFRADMIKYQKAVLLSQQKILRLLGAEVPPEQTARAEDQGGKKGGAQ
jgi:septal ring factor EnvC (AmiA/AmiB activator)